MHQLCFDGCMIASCIFSCQDNIWKNKRSIRWTRHKGEVHVTSKPSISRTYYCPVTQKWRTICYVSCAKIWETKLRVWCIGDSHSWTLMLSMSYRVKLNEWWCDCGEFQALRLPCPHVIVFVHILIYNWSHLFPRVQPPQHLMLMVNLFNQTIYLI